MRCRKDFLNLFEEILGDKYDNKTFEVFDPVVDSIHKNLRPKISLVGFSGVGKTTITKLIRAEEIPMQHIPTITGDIATVKIGKLHFHLWDFAGQEQFSYLWNNFIKGSDAVILITDSTLENVDKSKFFLELIKEQAPHAHTAIIGNKQDLEGALSPTQIEKFLGLKTYSMIAKDPENRDKMIKIIADILEMSAEVSPLLKPLLERDKLIEEASIALESAEFEKAALLFDKISFLCIELGDDSLGKEFFEKSQKILGMIKGVDVSEQKLDVAKEPITKEESKTYEAPEPSEKIINSKPKISIEAIEVPQPIQSNTTQSEISQTPISDDKTQIKKEIEQVSQINSSKILIDQDKSLKSLNEVKKELLKLNPEDFMVKIRPKSIGVVPKDAKSKLKTTAYGHVSNLKNLDGEILPNQTQYKKSEEKIITKEIPTPTLSPSQTEQKKPSENKIPVTSTQDSMEFSQPPSLVDNLQLKNLKRNLIDLKVKKSDLYKKTVDLEMLELEKKITKENFEEKMKEIKKYEKTINEKILELEKALKDLS